MRFSKKMANYFGLNRLVRLYDILVQNGGIGKSLAKLYR